MRQQREQERCRTGAIAEEQEQLKVKIRLLFPSVPFPHGISQSIKAKGREKTANGKTIPSRQPIAVIIRYLKEEKTFQKGTIINATKEEFERSSLNHWFCASSHFYININSHYELLHLNLVRNTFLKWLAKRYDSVVGKYYQVVL